MLLASCRPLLRSSLIVPSARCLSASCTRSHCVTTLAIETSCDDTSVAVIDVDGPEPFDDASTVVSQARCHVRYHRAKTAQSFNHGIHPLHASDSHIRELGALVREARECLDGGDKKPTFVSVTRGPGMNSSLLPGLQFAKGLAAAWDVPLLGVHHMQAHALTPRLCSAIELTKQDDLPRITPSYPFLTVLASGGHTMLVKSSGLVDHKILASTTDIAIGDCLDKAARVILPHHLLTAPYGRALEHFAFPNGMNDYHYAAPKTNGEQMEARKTTWGWALRPPLSGSPGRADKTVDRMVYSFTGLLASIERLAGFKPKENGQPSTGARGEDDFCVAERREMAKEVLRVAFEHVVSRILFYLKDQPGIETVVVSGGVAANQYFRHVLRAMLDARGHKQIKTFFPPQPLCTDNALMIAWTGYEMYMAGYRSTLSITPEKTWPLSWPTGVDAITSVFGWYKVNQSQSDGKVWSAG